MHRGSHLRAYRRPAPACGHESRGGERARVRRQRERGPGPRRPRRPAATPAATTSSTSTSTPTTTAASSPRWARTPPGGSPGSPSARIDLRTHDGAHPRLGAVDVVPFVPLDGATPADACAARGHGSRPGSPTSSAVPASSTGTATGCRRCPRSGAGRFVDLWPDTGPAGPIRRPGPWRWAADRRWWPTTSGWPSPTWRSPGRWPPAVRGDGIRALGLAVGDRVQVSMNLVDPDRVGPATAYDRVADAGRGGRRRAGGAAPRAGAGRRRPRAVGGAGPGRGPDGGGPAGGR